MPLNNPSPLISPPMGRSIQSSNTPSVSPQEWEYIQQVRRTGYDPNQLQQIQQNQQPQQMSDPYSDFESEYLKCSSTIQSKVMNDDNFKEVMIECDRQIQHMVEQIVRPQVVQTKEGRYCFEKLLGVFRELKDKYSKEEVLNMERLQKLMEDDVVRKRILEMEKENSIKSNGSGK